jgi:hypothetical protein
MKTWVLRRAAHPQAVCASCRQPIVHLPEVGWVVDVPGADTYDMCESNAFGIHVPLEGPSSPADERTPPGR